MKDCAVGYVDCQHLFLYSFGMHATFMIASRREVDVDPATTLATFTPTELARLEQVLREWGQTRDRDGHSMGPCARAAWDEAVRLSRGLPRTKDAHPEPSGAAWTDPYFYPGPADV